MQPRYQLQAITVDVNNRELLIRWKDGHSSRYPMSGLRKACPCVICSGGHEHMGRQAVPEIFLLDEDADMVIRKVQPVGNYALQLIWKDGHQTGIYRYEYLRDMCPVENKII